MSVIVSTQTAQRGQSAAPNRRRTNAEMILQPLWAGYLRAIMEALRSATPTAYGHYSARQALALASASQKLTALAVVIDSRRYVRSHRSKAERALFESLCILSDQIGHALRDVTQASAAAATPRGTGHHNTWVISNHIEAALLDLPKLDQMPGIASLLAHDQCLVALILDASLFD